MRKKIGLKKLKIIAKSLNINFDERANERELSDKIVARMTIDVEPKVADKYKFIRYALCVEEEVENFLLAYGIGLSDYYSQLKEYNNTFKKIKEEYVLALETFNSKRERLREDFINNLFLIGEE